MSRYVEYQPGTKYKKADSDYADNPDAFSDCGLMLEDNEVVVDIDHLSKEQISAFIKEFGVKTQIVWTDRGIHLYYRKNIGFKKRKDGFCALGFGIEMFTNKQRPTGVTIKRNGVLRKIDNDGEREELPWYFRSYKQFSNLVGLGEGSGRNNALFALNQKLDNHPEAEKVLRFVNNNLFDVPLPDEEFQSVSRQCDASSGECKEYDIATSVMRSYKTVIYQNLIWWWNGEEYVSDKGNQRFVQMLFKRCPGQKSTFIEEIRKQVEQRSPIKDDKTFPVRFKNGLLEDGIFSYYKDFDSFTPYFISIEYDPEAEVVPEVDEYINNIVDNDEDYRNLLLEAMAYPLVTDPEKMRSVGKFFIFRGNGANGKGTLLQIMRKIYNPKNCTSLDIKELTDSRYQVTMIGKLANLGDDIQPDAINNDQMKVIKNICTADTVEAKMLYKESFSTTFITKLFFTTNADIKSWEKGYAYRRRVMWMPMFNMVEKPDPKFITKMTTGKALKYWVRLIVEGCKRFYQNGGFTESEVVTEFNNQYHEHNNYMAEFLELIDIETDLLGKTSTEVKDLYQKYNDDDQKRWNSRLLKEFLQENYGIGIGMKRGIGKVFMRQAETNQDLFK